LRNLNFNLIFRSLEFGGPDFRGIQFDRAPAMNPVGGTATHGLAAAAPPFSMQILA